ncbi:MAG: TRAP transporter substrate-binding protein DctP [Oceanospirillaceae bacterium]|jgi:TRAP-type C4-dicarboxylate transport system substrate-binding protein|nr:TRAP transporter substrate-binding protein DctP [Oceanospirillaceae bacterium]MBT4443689.1 TRAP transporter substrate-binding protein DctP [Oceanospirillaceae bacterium]MBT6077583.1 TRAP transporter substrate-binding protein DctP [Oceanospirillaceae bacterium]MBT7329722.1 TRAP transporter substrate-binding protein DctP [Oceanospirillaceae bacterium]
MKINPLFAVTGLAIALASVPSHAVTEMKYASAAPANTPWVKHSELMRDTVSANSEDAIQISLFNGGQLGDEITVIKQVARGRIDIGGFSMTAAATMVPEMALMGVPYMWDSYEQLDCAMDQHLSSVFEPLFEKKGLKLLQWNELGWTNTLAKKPMLSPSDFDGYKIRAAPAKYSASYLDGMGANGVVLPFAETPAALQTGMVDGATLSTVTFVAAGFGKLAPHYTLSRHSHQSGAILMSTKIWNALSSDEQTQFTDGLAPVTTLRAQVRGMGAFLLNKYKEAGGPVYEQTPEQRAQWKAVVLPGRDALVASIGGDAATIWPQIEAAKQACSQ